MKTRTRTRTPGTPHEEQRMRFDWKQEVAPRAQRGFAKVLVVP